MKVSCRLALATLVAIFTTAVPANAQQKSTVPAATNYVPHGVPMPFEAKALLLDDEGDLVTSLFIYQPGDKLIPILKGPNGDPAMAYAANQQGDVLILSKPVTNVISAADDGLHGFYIYNFHNKTFRPVNISGLQMSQVNMNNSLQVVIGGNFYAQLFPGPAGSSELPAQKPQMTKLTCPDGSPAAAVGINNTGTIVGNCGPHHAANQRDLIIDGFIYDISSGKMTLLDHPDGGMTYPRGVTDAGIIVGAVGGTMQRGFVYENGKFTSLTYGSALRTVVPFAINNRGDILTYAGNRSLTAATPAGKPVPRIFDAIDAASKLPAVKAAYERALNLRGAAQEAPPKPHNPPVVEPNMTYPSGSAVMNGFGVTWIYRSFAPEISTSYVQPGLTGEYYLGFDADGSWFSAKGGTYFWNAEKKIFAMPLYAPRELKLPDATAELIAAWKATEQQQPTPAPQVPAAPYAVDAAITQDADGTYWVSYILKNFGPNDVPIKSKVVRPGPKAPPFGGLPQPVLGPGNYGSWIWIGDGAQAGMAAMFNFDPSGKLTWTFLAPQIASMYLPDAQKK